MVEIRLHKNMPVKSLFITISPNPKLKHRVRRTVNNKNVTIALAYSMLKQTEQYEYCKSVLRTYIYSDKTVMFATWELNKSGNVHFHALVYDPHIKTETMLKIYRRDIGNTDYAISNLTKGTGTDYMNNIVYVNDSITDRFNYMTKDFEDDMYMPYLSYNFNLLH